MSGKNADSARETAPVPGSMLLRASAGNGRYFVDRNGRPVFLQGAYIGTEFQDNIFGSPDPSNWSIVLSVLVDNNANLLRLWTAETTGIVGSTLRASPMPWKRSDVRCALDGANKFDLSVLDVGDLAHPSIDSPHYFERMRARVLDARAHSIYVSIMLFHSFGWENDLRMPGVDIWSWHPFNAANNINGVDPDSNLDGSGLELGSLDNDWQPYQDAYVKQVVDSVGDLDNVLYEVCNEAWNTPETNAWQQSVIRQIRDYERHAEFAPHAIGMTSLQDFDNDVLYASDADFVSPGGPTFEESPPLTDGSKVVVLDMDHIQPCTNQNSPAWPWKAFMRGHNLWYIYCNSTSALGEASASEQAVISRMGVVRGLADRLDLDGLSPVDDPAICSTSYCLHGEGECLAFLPGGGNVRLLLDPPGRYSVEWIDVDTGALTPGARIDGGVRDLVSPLGGRDAVVHIVRA